MTAVNRGVKKTQGRVRRGERQTHNDTFRRTNGDRLRRGDRRMVVMQTRLATKGDVEIDINKQPRRMSKLWI